MTGIDTPEVDTLPAPQHRSHERLTDTLASVPDDLADMPSYDDEWSIAQVAAHPGSGAQIFGQFLTAGLNGTPAPRAERFQPVRAEWNAKSPTEQVREAVDADARFPDSLDAPPADGRRRWQLKMFGSHQTLASLVRMRLAEHVLHTWDIATALDPSALLASDAPELIVDNLAGIAKRVGKPTSETLLVAVQSETPHRLLRLELGTAGVQLRDGDPPSAAALRLPAEAFIRLVYGRLDAEHTPPTVQSENLDLDTLRRAFPGV